METYEFKIYSKEDFKIEYIFIKAESLKQAYERLEIMYPHETWGRL